MNQPGHWFKYYLAHQLRLTVAGVEQMSIEEFNGWRAYFADKAQKQKHNARHL